MTINVIKDRHRPVDNTTLYNEINSQDECHFINMWYAIKDSNSVVRSINLSHKKIVQDALQNGLPEVLIVEEDVMFTDPGSLSYFMANKPAIYDLYLGGAYALNQAAKERMAREGPGAHEIHNFAGLHCYMIHKNYYEKFLAIPEDKHIDDQPGMGLFYVCYPFIALQHPGWSSNNRKNDVNYNTIISPEMIYHGNKDKTSS